MKHQRATTRTQLNNNTAQLQISSLILTLAINILWGIKGQVL